jgi:hypothetical protein
MKSIVLPIENSKEMKIIKAITQAIVDLMGPNLYKAVQFIIKKAMNPPKIPKIAVEAPTVNVVGLHNTLSVKPKSYLIYL